MPRFRAVRLELMASFRSAFTAGQLTRNAPAVLWREVRYVLGSCGAREEVENTADSGKPIGPEAKIL